MVEQVQRVTCRHCQSEDVVRDGRTRNNKQRYLCRSCGRTSRDSPQESGYSEADKATILRAYQERSSLRGLERTFGVSRNTVSSWLKKRREDEAANVPPTRLAEDACARSTG